MGDYKYFIKKTDAGYYFALYPNNSNLQAVGRSGTFETAEECEQHLNLFKQSGEAFKNDSSLISIQEKKGRYYFTMLYNEKQNEFYHPLGIENEENCKKTLESVLEKMNAPLKNKKSKKGELLAKKPGEEEEIYEQNKDNVVISGKKTDFRKLLKIVYTVLAGVLVLCTLVSTVHFAIHAFGYIKYRKGQESAISLTHLTITLANSSGADFDTFHDIEDHKELVNAMYDFYNPDYSYLKYYYAAVSGGSYSDYYDSELYESASEVESATRAVDRNLGDELAILGYDNKRAHGYGSYYLKYASFFEYCTDGYTELFSVGYNIDYLYGIAILVIASAAAFLLLVTGGVNMLLNKDKKSNIYVTENNIICSDTKGTQEFAYKDITSVSQAGFKSIKLLGNGFKKSILFLDNGKVIKEEIASRLSKKTVDYIETRRQEPTAPAATLGQHTSPAEELKKFKELLDMGAITQEEFDAKKKELLGL